MGLTHYWKRPAELPAAAFSAAVDDCKQLFKETAAELGGFEGNGEPLLNSERIVFNGRPPLVCEPFEAALVEFDRRGRPEVMSYCKTEHMPYDRFVKAVLIVLHHHLRPAFTVMSDAKPEDWSEPLQLTKKVLGVGDAFQLSRG